jgi:hypothetical protein
MTHEQQLADVQAKLRLLQESKEMPAVAPNYFTVEQVQAMIEESASRGFKAGFESVKAFIPVTEKPTTTLDLLNATFSSDEQAWFCNPSVLAKIDEFLVYYMDDVKMGQLKKMYMDFREFYESKN